MGKPTGFLEYPRCDGAHRPPAERLQDYAEFLLPPDPEELHRQSARCMDCGVPYCHAGMMVAGSSIGCPLMNLIPETNDLVYRGELKAAYERMRKTNPFPEITGRVCPALCEGSCTLGEHDRPVTIQEIERYVADTACANGWDQDPIPDAGDTGQTVAVVGAGPAGLACADSLRRLGHRVTAFERADRPGGFLMYGIPMMKLEKTLVLEQVQRLEERGVVFRTGQDIGTDIDAGILLRDFDAAVLCTGARRERALTVPGAGAQGVHTAVEFLTGVTKGLLEGGPPPISAKGLPVVVVGGGDTGADCVATCIRQGAKSVAQFEIVAAPPPKRAPGNPWPLWPKVLKPNYAREEARALYGRDICRYETTVQAVHTQNGRVTGVTAVQVDWSGGAPKPIPGTEQYVEAGLVLTAMGFIGTETALPDALGLPLGPRGTIQASEAQAYGTGGYRTSLPGVFAAGDARRGPSLVVWAIREGRQAALACHAYLSARP